MGRAPVDSRHLRYFVAVANALSFRRAAEELHIAQPALTRHIKALEETLGVRLFNRDKHHVELTPAGTAALERANIVLQNVGTFVCDTRLAEKGELGRLRVGFVSHSAYEYVPRIVRAYRALHPRVNIELHKFLATEQYDVLLQRKIDVAILRPLYDDPRVMSSILVRPAFYAALPSDHPLASESSIRLSDLSEEAFVTLPSSAGASFHTQVLDFCHAAGFLPKVIHEAADVQAVIGTVGSGMGVAIVPEPVIRLQAYGVAYVILSDITDTADFVIAWRRDEQSKLIAGFVELAQETLATPPAR